MDEPNSETLMYNSLGNRGVKESTMLLGIMNEAKNEEIGIYTALVMNFLRYQIVHRLLKI